MDNKRYENGCRIFDQVTGHGGQSPAERAGDLGRYLMEYGFGDVYGRKALSLRDRELAAISMLAARGGCERQLKVHIKAGLHQGLTAEEIEEVIIQVSVYAGFPAAINALNVFKVVLLDNKNKGQADK